MQMRSVQVTACYMYAGKLTAPRSHYYYLPIFVLYFSTSSLGCLYEKTSMCKGKHCIRFSVKISFLLLAFSN